MEQEIKKNFIMRRPIYCNIGFYSSLKPNPAYIYEDGFDKICEYRLDSRKEYPVGERQITITMIYGVVNNIFQYFL